MALPLDALTPPLKWHGGKTYLARQIVGLLPPHTHYVEAFAGGLAVLLAKDPDGVSEVANDVHGWLTNFWNVLREPALFDPFLRRVQATPFSEPLWEEARRLVEDQPDVASHDPVVAATAFFVYCRQSLAGRMVSFAPLSRTRTRRRMNEQASAWMTCIDGLPAVHARLMRVVIRNGPAVDLIQQQDGPETLFYLDPPYVPTSRSSPDVYDHEMTLDDHAALLDVVTACKGKFAVSGYLNPLYATRLRGWTRHKFDLPNNSAGGAGKDRMTEVVWCNF